MADIAGLFIFEDGCETIDGFLHADFYQQGEKRGRSDRDDEDDRDSENPLKICKLEEYSVDFQYCTVLEMLAIKTVSQQPELVRHQSAEQLVDDTVDQPLAEALLNLLNEFQEDEVVAEPGPMQHPMHIATQGNCETVYVRMCQHFERPDRSVLTEAFIMNVMHQEFPQYAHEWCATLQSSPQHRAILVQQMCRNRDVRIKLLFCLLSCVYFFQSTAGDELWNNRQAGFSAAFQGTVVRVLSDRVQFAETFRRNPLLMDSLRDSFAYLKHLYTIMGLRRNVCFLLMVVSCVEGRGVYHGRTSNGLSVPHKSYRYMIETLGGRVLTDTPVGKRNPADKSMIACFESI